MPARNANDYARVKLGIRSALPGRNALEKTLGPRMEQLVTIMERVTISHLHELGDKIVKAAQTNIENSSASGRTYTYVTVEDGVTTKVGEHTSSESGDFPSSYSEKLKNAITSLVRTSEMSVQIGVYSDEPGGEWPTAYFAGSKYVDSEGARIKDVVVVDEEHGKRTPISKYADYLENKGTSKMEQRPFLAPAVESELPILRGDFRKNMAIEVNRKFRKKTPIYFRLVTKKLKSDDLRRA